MSERVVLDELAAKDFELSFYFAQGVVDTQRRLLAGLHEPYAERFSTEELHTFADNATSVKQFIPEIPDGHKNLNPPEGWRNFKQEFTDRWDDFRLATLKGKRLEGARFYPAFIARTLIERDIKFIEEGRPSLSEFQPDPHASFFRNHVMLGNTTGSPTFDEVLFTVGHKVLDPMDILIDEPAQRLEAIWTAHHPGEAFADNA